jgi:hypothetical protein
LRLGAIAFDALRRKQASSHQPMIADPAASIPGSKGPAGPLPPEALPSLTSPALTEPKGCFAKKIAHNGVSGAH